ncbi:maleylpyruvate isomerase family mycothiol-dependent enzyme [Geodermatophilus sp. SYSU D01186]
MTPSAVRSAPDIPRIRHDEAMRLTATENARMLDLLRQLAPGDWTAATDCTRWTVRDMVVHLIASAQAQANPVEFARQVLTGRRLTAQIGGEHWVDGLNEAQQRARTDWTPDLLPRRWETAAAAALAARRRMPAPVRALPLIPMGTALGTDLGWKPLGYLFDMGFTRDVWTHRVDITRAVGRPMTLTAGHDGRIVADIVAEWSQLHDDPFTLELAGAAGGTYTARGGAAPITLDAVEFVRILSGRGEGGGVLRHKLPL